MTENPREPAQEELFSVEEGAEDEVSVRDESGALTGGNEPGGSGRGRGADAGMGGESGSVDGPGSRPDRVSESSGGIRSELSGGAESSDDRASTVEPGADGAVAETVDVQGHRSEPRENQSGEPGPAEAGEVAGAGAAAGVRRRASTEVTVPSGPRARAEANLAAIELVQQLERDERVATVEERAVLAGYSSWGAIPQIFEDRPEWADLAERLEQLLDEEQRSAAQMTTLNAHFTDPAIAAALWDQLEAAGFNGGTVLEPGCGSGNFIGQAPESAQMVGVELDDMTARIAHHLYPEATIRSEGFEKTRVPSGGLSGVIGNVPFGSYSPFDLADNAENLSIHNYFIHKSMKHLAPGGYGAFVTSSWTMDSKSRKARDVIADHSDLVAAVRLPAGAFSRVAGTEAQTDVLIFRRRGDGEVRHEEVTESWVGSAIETGTINGEDVQVATSRFFQEHPEFVMGEPEVKLTGFPARPGLVVSGPSGDELAQRVAASLAEQVSHAPERGLSYEPVVDDGVSLEALASGGFVREEQSGGFVGEVLLSDSDRLVRRESDWTLRPVRLGRGVSQDEAIALVRLKQQIREVIDAGSDGEGQLDESLERLNRLYDGYYEEYGPINRFTIKTGAQPSAKTVASRIEKQRQRWAEGFEDLTRAERAELIPDEELEQAWRDEAETPAADTKIQPHLTFLRNDPDFGKLLGLERFDENEQRAEKSLYFSAETFSRVGGERSAQTPADALSISLDETRQVDLARIGELLGTDETQAREQLGELVFDDPVAEELVTAEAYLSGDVRAKLAAAEAATAEDPKYSANVLALHRVVPEWVSMEAISTKPGVKYVSAEEYAAFIREAFEAEGEVREDATGAGWNVERISTARLNARVRFQYGTNRANPSWILGQMMNNKPVTVYQTVSVDGKDRRVPDEKETTLARQKASVIEAAFSAWVRSDPERVERIERRFNERMNSYVAPNYQRAGDALSLEGLAADRVPHPYQREAVARIANEPSVLLDHVVGAGKTGSMIMGAMELRRTGLAKKPWMVVPNHLVEQITREFSQWYPAANVLMIPTGISPAERNRYVAASAANDWDAVICPQTVFSKIKVSDSRVSRWLRDDIEAMKEARAETDSKMGAKAIAGTIKRAEKRLERIGSHKDVGARFEETGCDYLFVDEAHEYKNLARASEYRELACAGSDKATDLDYVLRTLRDLKSERAEFGGDNPAIATFATGTPVANSLAEMWVMGHYLRPDLMQRYGMPTIDGFGTTFTEAATAVEVKPSGVGFRVTNRIASFTNVEALMRLSSVYTSSVTRDQIPGGIPQMAGGKLIGHDRPASPQVAQLMEQLVDEADSPEGAKSLLAILGSARKVALDARMMDLEPDEDGGRARQVAEQILRIEENTKDRTYRDATGQESAQRGGLQLGFCDLGTPGGAGFNMYAAVKEELVFGGMDPQRIAFIHDAATDTERAQLFRDARAGKYSVLLGSTQKMGTGMNVQDRVSAIHHIDIPWRPADLEQREGRAFRQGNQNREVEVHNYVTAGTFDAYMWQTIARKAKFLDQLKAGTASGSVEDIGGLSMSSQEMIAAASGDERVGEWMQLNSRILELENLARAESGQTDALRQAEVAANEQVDRLRGHIRSLSSAEQNVPTGGFQMVIGGAAFTQRGEAGARILTGLKRMAAGLRADPQTIYGLARLGGLVAVAEYERSPRGERIRIGFDGVAGVSETVTFEDLIEGKVSGRGLATRIWNRATGIGEAREWAEQRLAAAESEVGNLKEASSQQTNGFSQQEELDRLRINRDVLGAQLGLDGDDEAEAEPSEQILSEDQMLTLGFSGEPSVLSFLRDGDVVEIAKSANGFDPGLYEIIRQDEGPAQARKQDSEEPARELGYGVNWELVTRQRGSLDKFERAVLDRDDVDDLVDGMEMHRRVNADEEVVARGRRVDPQTRQPEQKDSTVAGRVVSTAIGRFPRMVVEQGSGEHIELEMRSEHQRPVAVRRGVLDPEAEAAKQREMEQKREADRLMTGPGRMVPGDVLLADVEGVGQRGWIVDSKGHRLVDPDTGSSEGIKKVERWFTADLLPGRDLNAEEVQRLFGDALTKLPMNKLRIGDVVAGEALDPKKGPREPVRITSIIGGGMVEVNYRKVSAPAWESSEAVRRRDSTVIGEVLSRRHGSLSHLEKAELAVNGQRCAVSDLEDKQIGSWVLAPELTSNQWNAQARWVSGRLISVDHQVPTDRDSTYGGRTIGPQLDSVVELETAPGATQSLRIRTPDRVTSFVVDGGWPEHGIDFRGTELPEVDETENSVETEQESSSTYKELSGFEISPEIAEPIKAGASVTAEDESTDQETETGVDDPEEASAHDVEQAKRIEAASTNDEAPVAESEKPDTAAVSRGASSAARDGQEVERTVPDGTVVYAPAPVEMRAGQLRPGDRVQFGESAEFRSVLDIQMTSSRRVQVTSMGSEGPAGRTVVGAWRSVMVEPYPADTQANLSQRARMLDQVRAGDLLEDASGGLAEVLSTTQNDSVIELELLDSADEREFRRGYSTEEVAVRMAACDQDRVGIRGPAIAREAGEVQRGDLIRTRVSQPAVVVETVTDDRQTEIQFQMLGSDDGALQRVVKSPEEQLMIYQQQHRCEPATETKTRSETERDPSMEHQPQLEADDGGASLS